MAFVASAATMIRRLARSADSPPGSGRAKMRGFQPEEAVMEDAPTATRVCGPFGPPDRLEINPMYTWLQEHEPMSRV
jgi:hypothetical protein